MGSEKECPPKTEGRFFQEEEQREEKNLLSATNSHDVHDSFNFQMDNNEHHSDKKFKLRKQDIIRGHNSYKRILQNSITISSQFLKAFINIQDQNYYSSKEDNSTISPHFTNNVKVGFIIAKRKIKKAVLRNRLRRLLKETFRLNRYLFEIFPHNLNIILSLTDSGYEYFLSNKVLKYHFIEEEFLKVYNKLKNHLKIK